MRLNGGASSSSARTRPTGSRVEKPDQLARVLKTVVRLSGFLMVRRTAGILPLFSAAAVLAPVLPVPGGLLLLSSVWCTKKGAWSSTLSTRTRSRAVALVSFSALLFSSFSFSSLAVLVPMAEAVTRTLKKK